MNIDAKELNEKIDPVELLGYIGYEKSHPKTSGDEVRDFCPIHKGDTQQSLAISMSKHTYFCHSCEERGDLIDLYTKSIGTDFPTAINQLTAKFFCNMSPEPFQTKIYPKAQKEASHTPYTTSVPSNVQDDVDNTLAISMWDSASEEGHHEYFDRKKIQPCPGIRYGRDKMGNPAIIVPCYAANMELKTLHFISAGGKFFLSGGEKEGTFFPLGDIRDGERVFVAEGLATAITVWEALDKKIPVVSANGAGNVPVVVARLRERYPKIEITLALDNDEAGGKVKDKVPPHFSYCIPSFEGLSIPEGKKAKDFNDLVSVCNQSLEHVRGQIQNSSNDVFFEKLGNILGDNAFTDNLKGRTYALFEQEHKNLFAVGGLTTGFLELDSRLVFSKGDFVTIQAMSNHGKSTFMLQLAYQFITNPENAAKDPMCMFITYESSPIRIEEKLVNLISHRCGEGSAIKYDRDREEKYLYPNHEDFSRTITTYNSLLSQRKIHILKRTPLEQLEKLIDLYKKAFPYRMLVLFLDYFQIIDADLNSEGWERVKEISRHLEAMSITKEILIVTASQVNDRRQTREGRDLYNSSTTVIDILNHSHASLKANQDTEKLFKDKIGGESICTISAFKQKHGETFDLRERFLFNGYRFKENTTPTYGTTQKPYNGSKKSDTASSASLTKGLLDD